MKVSNKIFSKAEEMFMRYGAKSITMDDISKSLGISKKTLYQYVENKVDLINKVITFYVKRENEVMSEIQKKATDAIEEIYMISKHVETHLKVLQPVAMYDLKKYYNAQWELMHALHDEFIYNVIKENLEKGIKEGWYRDDLNIDIIAKLYVSRIDTFIDPKVFPFEKYNRVELHHEFIKYHLNATVSPIGKEKMKEYF